MTYKDIVNLSMNQTLARSINTSLVAILPVLSVLVIGAQLLGASTLQYFGLALVIGLTSGAYSSIFIASPMLAGLKEREPRYINIRQKLASRPERERPAHAAPSCGLVPGRVAGGRSRLEHRRPRCRGEASDRCPAARRRHAAAGAGRRRRRIRRGRDRGPPRPESQERVEPVGRGQPGQRERKRHAQRGVEPAPAAATSSQGQGLQEGRQAPLGPLDRRRGGRARCPVALRGRYGE